MDGARRVPWVPILLLVIGIAGLVLSGIEEARRSRTSAAATAGRDAPPFAFEKFGGGQVRSSELRGKVVMLDFWATWCGPCTSEMPTLLRLAQEYEAKGVVFVAASRDEPTRAKVDVGLFIDRRAPELSRYAAFADDGAADAYSVNAIPTMVLIDRKGRVHSSYLGAASERAWRARLDDVLAVAD